MVKPSVIIIGAGPAGLTAGYCLAKKGVPFTILEADPTYVGGIARTVEYKGFRFDIGGHRFFSKSREVEDLWTEILPNDMLQRPRSSRIYYRGKFFSYPLQGGEALRKLGGWESGLCVLSYLKAKAFPIHQPKCFEDWVTNHFGKRLFTIFFKTYTEKVWGMSCRQISADWAAQRIQGLSLKTAILNALFPRKASTSDQVVKTLIDSFRYPRLGPGMMWEACAQKIKKMGGKIIMGQKVVHCFYDASQSLWEVTCRDERGTSKVFGSREVISSAPLAQLATSISPWLSDRALRAAAALKYRDFLTIVLILKDRQQFKDNWIYIHDPTVKVGRIQNFKSWSPEMVPDPELCCYGLEYFCFEGDGLWEARDQDLIEQAKRELEQIGLAQCQDILDGYVVRQPKAYPVYGEDYASNVAVVRKELDSRFPSLHLAGRNGMHKYNNQDHAMMTAMLTVENILAGRRIYDIWKVNQDAEYQEGGSTGVIEHEGGRLIPSRILR